MFALWNHRKLQRNRISTPSHLSTHLFVSGIGAKGGRVELSGVCLEDLNPSSRMPGRSPAFEMRWWLLLLLLPLLVPSASCRRTYTAFWFLAYQPTAPVRGMLNSAPGVWTP